MSIRDLVLISVGELVLAATFALGIAVGISLTTRKDARHDDSNEGTKGQGSWNDWHRVERR